jgi:hypothetical protein
MERELPRTVRSLSPMMQRGVDRAAYELIVVDNGSARPIDLTGHAGTVDLRVLRVDPAQASASPVAALNLAAAGARGDLLGMMIDGARLASPGLLAAASEAARIAPRAVILSLGFHLGPKVQMESVHEGYDQMVEDRLLEQSGWLADGYRLFDVSVFAGSSLNGWFGPLNESNAIFMRRALWEELGGFDPAFRCAGGGLANLDLLVRAVTLPDVVVVTLLGEGTFHQVHGGVATNARENVTHLFAAEYERLRGRPFATPEYDSRYYGTLTRRSEPVR